MDLTYLSFSGKVQSRKIDGYTYVGLLIFLAVLGLVASTSLHFGSSVQRKLAEDELLRIGSEYREALKSFARATPVGQPIYPKSLDELIRDPRFPGLVRHLRKIYPDPITGNEEWGLMKNQDGSLVIGVFSLSKQTPIHKKISEDNSKKAKSRETYRDWVFK